MALDSGFGVQGALRAGLQVREDFYYGGGEIGWGFVVYYACNGEVWHV